jgi:hypothetical protein
MRTWLWWMMAGALLVMLLTVNGLYGEFHWLTVVTLLGATTWIGAGVLLAVRATLRFLRR